MADITCPRCGRDFVRRTYRDGVFEELAGLVFVYPFRCQLCGYRFLALQWGVRYQRIAADRRRYERVAAKLSAVLFGKRGEYRGVTVDLSIGGCAIDAAGPFLEGSLWSVRLQNPNDHRPITVEAAVVRSAGAGRIGLEFLRLASEDNDRLGHLMFELLKHRVASHQGIRNVDLVREPPSHTMVKPPSSPSSR